MEIRLHGRGGQGGVTCAKILAAIHARLGKSVQTFGDYAGERSGAPVRAYTRVSETPITNRNKVYEPDHVLVLDNTLLGDEAVAGLAPGGTLLVDSPEEPDFFEERFGQFHVATVDATSIARKHGIGTRSLVIVNTTIAGAYARVMDIPLEVVEKTYASLGFQSNLDAAREAYEHVRLRQPGQGEGKPAPAQQAAHAEVMPLTDHRESPPTGLRTGSWRVLMPNYVQNLAPCNAWCPAGNDVIGFVQAASKEGAEAAAALLSASTPLAATCGRVCPAPCMEGCNRVEYDGSVNIRALERWISDRVTVPRAQSEDSGTAEQPRSFAIVGGGPAGLTAAYCLARAGHKVTIYETEKQLGGVLRTGIPTYRLPRDVLDREIEAIVALGVEARCGQALDAAGLAELPRQYDGVIMATGMQWLRGLRVEGSKLQGVEQGIAYLHRVNIDGGGELSGHVVVLGGGNTAMDCARSALRKGAEAVTVAYRRTRKEMPAIHEEIEEAEEEGVKLLFQRQPVSFSGESSVAAIELAEVEMGEPDESGRRRPVVTDRTETLACDAVLLALGQGADTDVLPEGWKLRDGRMYAGDEPIMVFAAGDFSTGDGTVTHAIGDGRRAADRVLQALGFEVEVFERPDRTKAVPATDIRFDHFDRAQPAAEPNAAVEERVANFDEVRGPLPDALEGHRCFSCGHCTECDNCLVYCPEGIIKRQAPNEGYLLDYSYCKGCGICAVECPRKAMEMLLP